MARSIGSLGLMRERRLPFAVPLGFRTAQDRDGELVVSSVRGRARIGLVRGAWAFDPQGPLGFLEGRRPMITLALHPFHLMFGRRDSSAG